MKAISGTLIVLLVFLARAGAEEPIQDRPAEATTVSTDAIFESILQNLPQDMKARVDSASGAKVAVHQHTDKAVNKPDAATEPGISQREDALKQLPDALRERVRKTIKEMENDQQKRAVQFKDRKQPAND